MNDSDLVVWKNALSLVTEIYQLTSPLRTANEISKMLNGLKKPLSAHEK